MCEACGVSTAAGDERVECCFCNVVAHVSCALPNAARKARSWTCGECVLSLEDSHRRLVIAAADEERRVAIHSSAILLQARARGFVQHAPFRRLRRSVVRAQGAMRAKFARRVYFERFNTVERPYLLRVLGSSGMPRDEHSLSLEYYFVLSLAPSDAERQKHELSLTTMYQYETRPCRCDELGELGVDEAFLVPSSFCGMTAYLTLCSKTQQRTCAKLPGATGGTGEEQQQVRHHSVSRHWERFAFRYSNYGTFPSLDLDFGQFQRTRARAPWLLRITFRS